MKKAAIIGFGLCSLGVAIASLSATEFPPPGGGSGDYSVEARCRPSEMDYLVGFAYRTGMWMDQIQPLCAGLKSAVQFGGRRHLKERGGTGGGQGEQYCQDDEVISAVKSYVLISQGTVHAVDFVCSSLKTWAARTISFGPKFGNVTGYALQQCPYGEVASGIQVRYGKYVNAIGLICDPFKVPVATLPPPPKQSPQQTCNDKCAPLLTTVHPAAEANRVHQNCMALCTDGANATITCPNGTTVKGTQPCK
jgi:hypothetical protein